jgi:hypothetical protein
MVDRSIICHSIGGGYSGPWHRFPALPFDHPLNRHGAVPRDPFSVGALIVTSASAAAGVGVALGSAAFIASSWIVGSVVVGAALYGANYALQSTLGKTVPKVGGIGTEVSPALINTPEARGTIRQVAAPARRIYGRIRVGGIWTFYDDSTPPYQYLQLALCKHKISAIRAVYINKNKIVFSGGNVFNTILTPLGVLGQDYVTSLRVCFRQGDDDQTIDPLLAAAFPSSGDAFVFDEEGNVKNLPASFRQRGWATASFRAHFGTTREQFEVRWGQVAFIDPQVEVDGALIYDPRDPTQDIDDPSTYKFTRNAALIQADWMRQPFGGRIADEKIRWDEVADAANYDDEVVHDKDGNPRPRHQIDGLVLLNQNPRHVTEAMLTANRAFVVQSRGRVGWVPARPRDPVLTLTEKDIVGGFTFQMGQRKTDTFNRVRTRFSPPEKDYAEDDGPLIDRPDEREDEDGGELLETSVRTPFTVDHRAVQWLAQQFIDEARLPRSWEFPSLAFKPRLLKLKIGDVVRIQHKRYPEINGIGQLRKDGIAGDFSSLSWSLREYDKSISQVARASQEQDYEAVEA